MRIIIAGAGEVGYHLAKLLSNESLDIVIIDKDKEKLQRIENSLDVMTFRGDVASFQVLEDNNVDQTDIFITVTDLQNTNLVSALLAKKLGAKKTIARISNPEFLERRNNLAITRSGIDMLISPEELAAKEIENLIEESVFNEVHSFEGGLLNLFGVILDENASILNKTVKQVAEEYGNRLNFVPIYIIRTKNNGYETIIPRGSTVYEKNDHVYFIATDTAKETMYKILGRKEENLSDVMILGGGRIGTKTAKFLCSNKHNVKIIERDRNKALDLADELRKALVIHGDGRDSELLNEEGIKETDAFIAVTGRSETNIMACLLAKSKGVKKTVALVENTDYIHLSQEIGIDGFINKKLMAANAIFKHIRKGKVLDVTNLYDLNAEVLEYQVQEDSRIANKTIGSLNFPKTAIIGGIIRKGKAYLPTKDFTILPRDKVVIFSEPESLNKVEDFFEK